MTNRINTHAINGLPSQGVAFPLDTLKTKSQILSQKTSKIEDDGISTSGSSSAKLAVTQMNMIDLFVLVYKMEGSFQI